MSFPSSINISIDTCNNCGCSSILPFNRGGCGCPPSLPAIPGTTPNSPCSDCEVACEDAFMTDCIFYSAVDIPALGITKNEILTSIIIKLSAKLINLEARILALENP